MKTWENGKLMQTTGIQRVYKDCPNCKCNNVHMYKETKLLQEGEPVITSIEAMEEQKMVFQTRSQFICRDCYYGWEE